MKKAMVILLTVILSLMTVTNAFAGKAFNSAKIKQLFSQDSNGDWTFSHQSNSSDCITSFSIQLSPQGDGTFQTGIYGYYYSKSEGQFQKTTGYSLVVDGHKYSFNDSPVTVSFSTNMGKAECAYVVHSKLNDALKEMKNAKEIKIEISFEMWGISGISVVHTYSGNDSGMKTLKSMVNALFAANYFDNLSAEESVFESLVTATETYE